MFELPRFSLRKDIMTRVIWGWWPPCNIPTKPESLKRGGGGVAIVRGREEEWGDKGLAKNHSTQNSECTVIYMSTTVAMFFLRPLLSKLLYFFILLFISAHLCLAQSFFASGNTSVFRLFFWRPNLKRDAIMQIRNVISVRTVVCWISHLFCVSPFDVKTSIKTRTWWEVADEGCLTDGGNLLKSVE